MVSSSELKQQTCLLYTNVRSSGRRKVVEDGGTVQQKMFPSLNLCLVSCVLQDRARNGDPLMKRLFLESWLLSSLLIVDKLHVGLIVHQLSSQAGIICVVDASAFWEMYNSGSLG